MRIEILRGTVIDGAQVRVGAIVDVAPTTGDLLVRMGRARPAAAGPETATAARAPERATRPPRKREMRDVAAVPGIGAAWAEKLAEHGIVFAEQLAGADVATLAALDGVGRRTAEKWIAAAKELTDD